MELKALIRSAETHIAQGRWSEAADIYVRLTRLLPREPDIHHVHGLVLMELEQWKPAIEQFDRAIALNPQRAIYYRNRGDALHHCGELQQATEAFKNALSVAPHDSSTMINLGNTLCALGRPTQALQWYENAAGRDPSNPMALNNIGKLLHDQGRMDQALRYYDQVLAVHPDYAEAHFNRSVLLLAQGDYASGWEEYEWRFKRKSARQVYPRVYRTEPWDGSFYTGKRLLIHCEQGMGDMIQFCRYLPRVKALGGTLIVEAHAPLIPLLSAMNAADQVVPFSAHRHPPVPFDLFAPLLRLPRLFGTTLNNLPNQVPYLHADPQRAATWRDKYRQFKGLRVGLVWSGSAVDPGRACPIERIETLFSVAGTHFFCLQKGLTDQSIASISKYANVTHWGDQLNDFGDTAAAIEGLDLVISVDTAAAHLAGAMGKPVWVLLPAVADWRWLLDREDSPWYPTARLFRQHAAGDWPALLDWVRSELKQLSVVQGVFERGCRHLAEHRWDDAIRAYAETIALAPDTEPAYRNMALAYFQKGDPGQAAACYHHCLELKPDTAEVLTNLGAAYQHMRQPSRAEACFAKVLEIDPRYVPAIYNLGNIRLDRGDLESAAALYRRSLSVDPGHISSMCNLGRTLHRLGLLDEALACYDRALKISPDHPETRFNRSVTLLLQGRWEEGWPDYEWRFQCHNRCQIYPHRLPRPRWQGEPFSGKTLLVHGEQGLGDSLQFVRFLPWVKRLGGRVLFETHKSLLPLFDGAAGIDGLLELSFLHPPAQPYDLHVPLCSLPGLFKLTPHSPPLTGRYLSPPADKVKQWRTRLPHGGINAGIVWSGSDTYPERSCHLRDLAPLGQIDGIRWFGLQQGPGADQMNDPHLPTEWALTNWGPEFHDFSDTAAAVASLDLIISIDTSVAHLAGALGKPTWLLLPRVPDWRWLLRRSDTPWYPSVRLFRQTHAGDWRPVVREIGDRLQRIRSSGGQYGWPAAIRDTPRYLGLWAAGAAD
jgi:tetratricopeptide (TPR) repeat protein